MGQERIRPGNTFMSHLWQNLNKNLSYFFIVLYKMKFMLITCKLEIYDVRSIYFSDKRSYKNGKSRSFQKLQRKRNSINYPVLKRSLLLLAVMHFSENFDYLQFSR